MTEDKKKKEVGIDLGLGGLFKGLSELMDSLGALAQTGEELQHSAGQSGEVRRSGTFQVKGLGDKARGVYGFSVRTGIGGAPQVERFGNIRATDDGPEVSDVREPLEDLFDEGQELLVVFELPGVSESEIAVELHGDILSLTTNGQRKYAKELLLPSAVQADSLRTTYRNGILELRLTKLQPSAG
jgi:HSP20 family protein